MRSNASTGEAAGKSWPRDQAAALTCGTCSKAGEELHDNAVDEIFHVSTLFPGNQADEDWFSNGGEDGNCLNHTNEPLRSARPRHGEKRKENRLDKAPVSGKRIPRSSSTPLCDPTTDRVRYQGGAITARWTSRGSSRSPNPTLPWILYAGNVRQTLPAEVN
uniref:Uncharacterized protein n=1 Tax=Trichuris muris TaxID=70415 RepID=A0A5S6QHW1_TRIMR